MKAIIQRVSSSSVKVEGEEVAKISQGLNVLLGVEKEDSSKEVDKLLKKIINLRIFQDENDKMNKSLLDIQAELLIISQFTLAGNCKKGRRPSFDKSAEPKLAKQLYKEFIKEAKHYVKSVQTGIFGAKMDVQISNDGPVTFILDTKEL
ncbi:D-tyrosyl-tRNA(Tyr) deacylase [Malaciobacter halophilus]|uniref:D-aminoacyl-tRNA deacylase n=1 Tax=Malaciobacter halophilus TaxID=197482 RepID=A0A2N1J0U0_9BACT|nr:D-aminoacyl-tRNA deacylase [Malaciobacter halophilus]AXH08455.1 D-aminoacyl-tRNA deacylase [Malaciobacter halophilus]PKI80173.1 D-tyrosyl-tRNA(Tyr) deacylase [Malaciobacter halophilus]